MGEMPSNAVTVEVLVAGFVELPSTGTAELSIVGPVELVSA